MPLTRSSDVPFSDIEVWHPVLELASPVLKGDPLDEMWPGKGLSPERNCLQRLAGEDTVDAVVVKGDHPVEALERIVTHGSTLDVCDDAVQRSTVRKRDGLLTSWGFLEDHEGSVFGIVSGPPLSGPTAPRPLLSRSCSDDAHWVKG